MKPDANVYWSAHDTFIDPVASNVYELLFESEDESADARQVHAGLSASLFLPAPLMRIIRPSCFIRALDISTNPFRSNGTPIPRLEPPAFLICLGHIVVLRLTKFQRQDSIN